MTRRTLWTTLALVLVVLAVASLAPRHGPVLLAWLRGLQLEPVLATLRAAPARVSPATAFIGGGILAGGLLLLLLGSRYRTRRAASTVPAGATTPFATQLAEAMRATVPHGGARRREAEGLVRSGMATEEIARTTRLSRDAIRVIGAAIAAAERHELPPHHAVTSSR
jgi:hypothetical protein